MAQAPAIEVSEAAQGSGVAPEVIEPSPVGQSLSPTVAERTATESRSVKSGQTQKSPDKTVCMFKSKHLFVELHEFHADHWRETHRWNHGLEEELVRGAQDEHSWTAPHLPSISFLGLAALQRAVRAPLVLLDVDRAGERALEGLAEALVKRLADEGRLSEQQAGDARRCLCERLAKPKDSAHVGLQPCRQPVASPASDGDVVAEARVRWAQQTSAGSAGSIGVDDPLNCQSQEEVAQIVVDSASWLTCDVVLVARFKERVVTGLEESVQSCRAGARFVAICLSPASPSDETRHLEMGRTVAALMQDDRMAAAIYAATEPEQVVDAMGSLLKDLKLMPQSAVPTEKAIMRRAKKMMTEVVQSRKKLLATQEQRWSRWQQNPFKKGLSISGVTRAMQKFAVPLLAGIAISLVLANVDEHKFDFWAGYGPGIGNHGGAVLDRPDAFGIDVNHHKITIRFIVNDCLMCLFFGLAAKEITESLQPGGSLYPPTRTTVNVLAATLGGVVGPVVVYLGLVSSLHAAGVLNEEYSFAEYANGWGVPTATDISLAWVTALCVFGAGHPAINYLLLLAIIDDGIGLMIIAFAYPDPHNPVKPVYLLLVVAAMLVSLALRRLRCTRWQVYMLLAGPLAWCGLLYAALHPSLALVFVVPFIPMHVEDDIIAFAWKHDSDATEHGHKKSFGRGTHPLHEFEEATKDFVDFIVLFAFGLVNAGVQVDSAGWLTVIVLVSLVAGKTMGIAAASAAATCVGCPPPAGMSKATVAAVGFIASAGLTVALFVSGEAFEASPELMAQAKMGALLSVCVAFVAVGASYLQSVLPSFSACASEDDGSAVDVEAARPLELVRQMSEDERLEDIVVGTAVWNIKLAHTTQDAILNRSGSELRAGDGKEGIMPAV